MVSTIISIQLRSVLSLLVNCAYGYCTLGSFVAVGDDYFIVKTNTSLFVFGDNSYGQLNISPSATSLSLTQINFTNVGSVAQVTAGSKHTLVLFDDGSAVGFGENEDAQICQPPSSFVQPPKQVSGMFSSVSPGDKHTVGVTQNGKVFAWGNNDFGQLGNLNVSSQPALVTIPGNPTITKVAQGSFDHVLVLSDVGLLYGWGNNEYGQLGTSVSGSSSSLLNVSTPVWIPMPLNTSIDNIYTGKYHSLALSFQGVLITWGNNDYGQLGDGSTASKTTPNLIQNFTFLRAAAGATFTIAITTQNHIVVFGSGIVGGYGSQQMNLVPTDTGFSGFGDVVAKNLFAVLLQTSGQIWVWGTCADTTYTLPTKLGVTSDSCPGTASTPSPSPFPICPSCPVGYEYVTGGELRYWNTIVRVTNQLVSNSTISFLNSQIIFVNGTIEAPQIFLDSCSVVVFYDKLYGSIPMQVSQCLLLRNSSLVVQSSLSPSSIKSFYLVNHSTTCPFTSFSHMTLQFNNSQCSVLTYASEEGLVDVNSGCVLSPITPSVIAGLVVASTLGVVLVAGAVFAFFQTQVLYSKDEKATELLDKEEEKKDKDDEDAQKSF